MPELTTDEKIEDLREWLRMHGDYDVKIDLHASYRTIRVNVTHLNRTLFTDIGVTFGKRLDKAREFLDGLDV